MKNLTTEQKDQIVRGVLGGWIGGTVQIGNYKMHGVDGAVCAAALIVATPAAVRKWLRAETAKTKGKR